MWLTFRVHQHLRCPVQTNGESIFFAGLQKAAKKLLYPGSSWVFVGCCFWLFFCMSLSPKNSQNCWKNLRTPRRLGFFGSTSCLEVKRRAGCVPCSTDISIAWKSQFLPPFLIDVGWWIMIQGCRFCLFHFRKQSEEIPPLNGTVPSAGSKSWSPGFGGQIFEQTVLNHARGSHFLSEVGLNPGWQDTNTNNTTTGYATRKVSNEVV